MDSLRLALADVGRLLELRQRPLEVLLLGGTALHLQGWLARPTMDLDVAAEVKSDGLHSSRSLREELDPIFRAVASKHGLPADWLDVKSTDLLLLPLPDGILARCSQLRFSSFVVWLPARDDLAALKLYAAATSSGPFTRHYQDLQRLVRDGANLSAGVRWCISVAPHLAGRIHEIQEDIRRDR